MKNNFFAKFWETFRTPRHSYKRRRKRKYDGAKRDRFSSDWATYNSSADSEIYSSLSQLRARSRDLIRNNDYARNAVRTIVNNVIFKGITLQAQVSRLRGEGTDEIINNKIEREWKKWCGNCDVTGVGNFNQLQRLIMRSIVESGDVFIRLINQPFNSSSIPLGIEIIEADRVSEDRAGKNTNNLVKLGVEVDKWGAPLAYWLYDHHPGDTHFVVAKNRTTGLQRIEAGEIIHLFLKERPGQTRGVPWLHSSINRLRNVGQYEQSELIAARASSNIVGLITTPDADLVPETEIQEVKDSQGNIVEEYEIKATEDIQAGVYKYLSPGEEFASFNPSRPNTALPEFNRHMLRAIACGLGLSYESLSKDYSQSNYSSSRLALIESKDLWRTLQSWWIESFLDPLYKEWLDLAVLSGVLNFPDYEKNKERYQQVKWVSRGWEWVDPDKELKAIEKALQLGLSNPIKEAAKNGDDFEELCKQSQKAKELAELYGLELNLKDSKKELSEDNAIDKDSE